MDTILETAHLAKRYKNFQALNDLNIHVEKGAIYGLIGKNGAGKTTLIRIISGLQKPTDGSYTLYGESSSKGNPAKMRRQMGAIIETSSIYGDMNARDNLLVQYKLVGTPSAESIDELLKLVGLENTGKKKAKNFSLGMKQRLGIAIALAGKPDFLILDEPINGLDPQGIIEIRELILKLNREQGITILISSHYLDELSKIATHYGFLESGSIIKEISNAELMKQLEYKIQMKVSDKRAFADYFDQNGIAYETVNDETFNVFGEHNLSKFVHRLFQADLVADEIHEQEESLESYYMNLIGGSAND